MNQGQSPISSLVLQYLVAFLGPAPLHGPWVSPCPSLKFSGPHPFICFCLPHSLLQRYPHISPPSKGVPRPSGELPIMPHYCTQPSRMAPSTPSTTSYLDSRPTFEGRDFSDASLGGELPQSGHWTMCPHCAPPPQIFLPMPEVPRPLSFPSLRSVSLFSFSHARLFPQYL